MLIPFFAWSLIASKFFFTNSKEYNLLETFNALINGGGLWFLLHLFYITILYTIWLFVSVKINPKENFWIDSILMIIVSLVLATLFYFKISPIVKPLLIFYLFYFVGVLVSKYDFFTSVLMKRETFTVGLLLFMILVGHYNYGDSSYLNLLIKYTCALSAIGVFYFFIRNINWNSTIDNNIRFWGVNSLIIYVTHFHIVNIFSQPFISNHINQIPLLVFGSILSIIICFISLWIYEFINKSALLNFLLFGGSLRLRHNSKPKI